MHVVNACVMLSCDLQQQLQASSGHKQRVVVNLSMFGVQLFDEKRLVRGRGIVQGGGGVSGVRAPPPPTIFNFGPCVAYTMYQHTVHIFFFV